MDALQSAIIGSWIADLSLPGAIVLFGIALARNWMYTSGQVSKMIEAKQEVARLWEKVATERQETIKLLTEANEPIIQGNEAILRAVESLQIEQHRRSPPYQHVPPRGR